MVMRYRNRPCEIELERCKAADAIVHADELAAVREEVESPNAKLPEIFESRRRSEPSHRIARD
jgi:hypothetical protein